MKPQVTARSAIVDAALYGTNTTDNEVLQALCDLHVSATEAACLSNHQLLDWDEYESVGGAL